MTSPSVFHPTSRSSAMRRRLHGLAATVVLLAGGHQAIASAPARTVSQFSTGWQFADSDLLTAASAAVGEGAGWQPVAVPHSWNTGDAASIAQTTPASKPYRRGIGWYRLPINHSGKGGTQWLQFDGASIVADVWLNGVALGQHKGAFSSFRFNVTDTLKPGKNMLVVRVDNSAPLTASDPTAIAPLSGDFNMSGGLYREVSLISTAGRAHIALDDLGSSGVYFQTRSISPDGSADLGVRVKLRNGAAAAGRYVLTARLLDARGRTAASASARADLAAGVTDERQLALRLAHAHLWHGVADPYLYRMVVELRDPRGAIVDTVNSEVGVRQMRFDPAKGFVLNGVVTPLHGVNLHQDFQGKGWVASEADVDTSLAMIKEIGANTVRLAHYPHSAYTLRQADKLGFVVWAEAPFVERSLTPQDCKAGSKVPEAFSRNLALQTQELIRQQFNHASVAMWSVANEVAMSGICQGVDTVTPLLRAQHALAKAEDPTRVTTLADFNEDMTAMKPMFMPMATGGITDIWAVNRYPMWYYPISGAAIGTMYDALHAKYPLQPMGVSEYGAGAALTHQTDNPLGGIVANFDFHGRSRTLYQPEGHANYVHEQNYAVLASRPYLWGTYVWNMFDFGSGIRHEGDIGGTNTKGLVSFDRLTRKDPFYFYKANWSSAPVTYITGRRYTERAYRQTDVKVYSNARSVTLEVNGQPHATLQASDCPMRVCVFPAVALREGSNRIVARGEHAGGAQTDTVEWSLSSDNASNVYIAAGQPATGFMSSDGHRYGSDDFFSGGQGVPLEPDGTYGERFNTTVTNVAEARDRMLWSTIRFGSFSYTVPLPNGRYEVTLGMLEPRRGAAIGSRVFDVAANGATAISGLDIFAEAGGHSTAIWRSFEVSAEQGRLVLEFQPRVGEAVLSNIRITRR